MRSGVVLVVAVLLSGCQPLRTWRRPEAPTTSGRMLPRIPRDAARFEIDSVTDSTATFRVREARWVRPGLQSYVVDPQQRDALVARLRVIARDSTSATALVTGQVTSVRPEHFLLVVRPERRWWESRAFWGGTLAGVTIGVGGMVLVR